MSDLPIYDAVQDPPSEGEEEEIVVVPIVLNPDSAREAYQKSQSEDKEQEELEFVFDLFSQIEDLSSFRNLKKLILVGNGLEFIPSSLQSLSRSLEVLYFCQQRVSTIQNLNGLTKLKELYLYSNLISVVEGLDGCAKLEKLWIFSNRITKLSNLSHLSNLNELWLQDNLISHLPSSKWISPTVERIRLSGNPMEDLKESIKALVSVTSLADLSFSDHMFPAAPLCTQEGYRSFVLFHLKQLQLLDEVEIQETEIDNINDSYFKDLSSFTQKLDLLKKESREQMKAIQYKRKSLEQKSISTKKYLFESFVQVEASIEEERSKLLQRYSVESQNRLMKRKELEKHSALLLKNFQSETEKYLEIEKEALKNVPHWKNMIGDQRLQQLSYFPRTQQVCCKLNSMQPEYRFVKSHFHECSATKSEGTVFKMNHIYKNFENGIQSQFEKVVVKLSNPKIHRLYCLMEPNSIPELKSFVLGKNVEGLNVAVFTEEINENLIMKDETNSSWIVLSQVVLNKVTTIKFNFSFPLEVSILKKMKEIGESAGCICLENEQGKKIYCLFSLSCFLPEYIIFFSKLNPSNPKPQLSIEKYSSVFLNKFANLLPFQSHSNYQ